MDFWSNVGGDVSDVVSLSLLAVRCELKSILMQGGGMAALLQILVFLYLIILFGPLSVHLISLSPTQWKTGFCNHFCESRLSACVCVCVSVL